MALTKQLVIILLASLVFASCSRNPVTGKREMMLMSESQEIALGKQSDPEIVKAYGLYEDQKLQQFITNKGMQMAKISHRPDLNYEFKILDSPVVNAFAVPGGYVYFTRGILAHFNNEAEFAGVLGHEIGHITARHSAKQYSKQMIGQLLFVGGMIASKEFRQFADVANQGMGLLFLKFGRDAERQSDELGVDYSTEIGYNADAMAHFFKTLQRMRGEGQNIPTFMSTHPDPGDRYNRVKQLAAEQHGEKGLPASSYKIGRDSYLKMIDGMIYGEDPKQGYVENSKFYHPELKFYFEIPANWKTQNSPSQFQMAPPNDGKALMLLQIENASNLDQAASQVIERNKIKVIEQSKKSVNRLPARAILGEQTPVNQQGQPGQTIRVVIYLIEYNGLIYKMIGLTVPEKFNGYFRDFQSTMSSFKPLTDQSKIDVHPDRLKIVTARSSGTLKQVLTSYKQKTAKHNELAIINGMELTDQVKSGQMLKILTNKKN